MLGGADNPNGELPSYITALTYALGISPGAVLNLHFSNR